MNEEKKQADESAELMYVKCAYCGKWMDVKPGQMNWVSHGLCDDCLKKELEKIRAHPPGADNATP
ncbi:MAG: hypothetical protein BWY59_00339 [Verrucomicrobia bacterium ADurb.Bin345]|nr:MAG: hypothetical protein BWY59_00339 [Verrucomicrobia bacterium ADurb.Bin345]